MAFPGQVVVALMGYQALSLKSGEEQNTSTSPSSSTRVWQGEMEPAQPHAREGHKGTRVTTQLSSCQHFPTAQQVSEERILQCLLGLE